MNTRATAALAAFLLASGVAPAAAVAQSADRWSGDQDARFQRVDEHTYRGRDGRYHYRCKRSSGTTGLVAGGVGGGLIGHAVGGGTVGTLLGAGGGALLGRHLDKKHDEAQNRRNGC